MPPHSPRRTRGPTPSSWGCGGASSLESPGTMAPSTAPSGTRSPASPGRLVPGRGDRLDSAHVSRRRDSFPRNIHVAAAASPQLVSTEYPRRSRGGAATRLHGYPLAAAAAPRPVFGRSARRQYVVDDELDAVALERAGLDELVALVPKGRPANCQVYYEEKRSVVPDARNSSPLNFHVAAAASPRLSVFERSARRTYGHSRRVISGVRLYSKIW